MSGLDAAAITGAENPLIEDTFAFTMFVILVVTLAVVLTLYLFFSAAVMGWILSSFLNYFVLKDKRRIRIGAVHCAWLRGKLFLREVIFTSRNVSVFTVDAELSIKWWRPWTESSALVVLSASGLEVCLTNNSARYDHLVGVLESRNRSHAAAAAVDEALTMGLEFPPDIPSLFWLCRTVQVYVNVGCISIGNTRLPTTLVISFTRAQGNVSLVRREVTQAGSAAAAPNTPSSRRTSLGGAAPRELLPCNRAEVDLHLHDATLKVPLPAARGARPCFAPRRRRQALSRGGRSWSVRRLRSTRGRTRSCWRRLGTARAGNGTSTAARRGLRAGTPRTCSAAFSLPSGCAADPPTPPSRARGPLWRALSRRRGVLCAQEMPFPFLHGDFAEDGAPGGDSPRTPQRRSGLRLGPRVDAALAFSPETPAGGAAWRASGRSEGAEGIEHDGVAVLPARARGAGPCAPEAGADARARAQAHTGEEGREAAGRGGGGAAERDEAVLSAPLVRLKYYDDLCGHVAAVQPALRAAAGRRGACAAGLGVTRAVGGPGEGRRGHFLGAAGARAAARGGARSRDVRAVGGPPAQAPPAPPPLRTNWTRLVPPPPY